MNFSQFSKEEGRGGGKVSKKILYKVGGYENISPL